MVGSTALGPLAAGGFVGESVTGFAACAEGAAVFHTAADPSPGLVAFELKKPASFYVFDALLDGPKAYSTGFDGWFAGGYLFSYPSSSEISSPVSDFERFLSAEGGKPKELTVSKPTPAAAYTAYGIEAFSTNLCVYAASLVRNLPALSISPLSLSGDADGMLGKTAVTHRLSGSRASLDYDKVTAKGTLKLDLQITDTPFGNYRPRPTSTLASFETVLTSDSYGQMKGTLTSIDGQWTGQVLGQVGPPTDRTAVFAFAIAKADGTQAFGAAALGDPSGHGHWDY
jgi:hypothetical protein